VVLHQEFAFSVDEIILFWKRVMLHMLS